jgi:hypothetical protein
VKQAGALNTLQPEPAPVLPSSLIQLSEPDENPAGNWICLAVYLGCPKQELATASPHMNTKIVRGFVFIN